MDRRLLLALAAFVLATGCDDEELATLVPEIAVASCEGGAVEVDGTVVGGVTDCRYDVGAVEIAFPRSFGVAVTNPTNIALRLDDVSFLEGTDPAFELTEVPTSVPPGRTSIITVWARPQVAGEVAGTLRITSDADNNPVAGEAGLGHVDVELVATGVDSGTISVSVSPPACDFGPISPGATALCEVQVAATGEHAVVLSDAQLTGDTAFSFVALPPEQVPAGASVTVGVAFTPSAVAGYSGTLRFGTNDPQRATVEVPLSGAGTDGPSCSARISAVNGTPTEGAVPMLEPLDDITLTLTTSHPGADVAWTFQEQPVSSTLTFVSPDAVTTGVVFDGTKFGIDVAGDYRVRAQLTDPATGDVGACNLSFSAVPTDELVVQLTWDTPTADVDLHLIQEDDQGRYCARSVEPGPMAEDCGATVIQDCYFWSCKPANSLRPDWDGDGAVGTVGDPSLDVDDRCGFGPEHINVDFPVAGTYLLGVDHFGFSGCPGAGASGVTVRIYAYGQLAGEWFRDLNEGDWWEVALIEWPAGTGTVCIDDLSVDGDECP